MITLENKQLISIENLDRESSVKNKASTDIQILPNDVLYLIFSQSGCKELGKLMQLSKKYFKIASLPFLWKMTLLKEMPNLINECPCLNNVSPDQIDWKKVYLDETPSNANIKLWEGPHIIKIAFMYKNRQRQIAIRGKTISLDLTSNELSIKILKKIVIEQLEIPYKPRQIDLSFCSRIIPEKNNLPLKDIKISGPFPLPTFMDLVGNEKIYVFISKKTTDPLPEDILPEEWKVQENEQSVPEDISTVQDLPTNTKKNKFLRKNCAIM